MSLREATQQALEAMACMRDMVAHPDNLQFIDNAITALRTALAEPERKPLTDEEIAAISAECAASAYRWNDFEFARAVIAAYQRKQGGV
jgi:hypothetical protein